MVVVPVRPGPIVALASPDRSRSEIDELLDDVFGEPDNRGPGITDAVLVLGGAAAVVIGAVASSPVLIAIGVGAVLLGSILPLRSFWRRAASAKSASRVQRLVGDGMLLRTDHPEIGRLVAAHDALVGPDSAVAPDVRLRIEAVAHAAACEVATMLEGRAPSSAAETEYIVSRITALKGLARALRDGSNVEGDRDRRVAMLDARREVEDITGSSSVTDAGRLAEELLGDDGN
jgi:hypothetical protein